MSFDPDAPQGEKIQHYCAVAKAYIDAINDKDLEAILACYAEDAEVHDPVGQRDFKGKTELRQFYAGVITRAQMEIVGPIRGSSGPYVATPVRARIPGMEIDVITVTRFNDQGLIQEYSAFWGPNNIRKTTADVVIIGGGHAGGEVAFRLRQAGYAGSISLFSAEPHLPYQRPPLSKSFLAGEATQESLLSRNAEAYTKAEILWHPSTAVSAIDRVDRRLTLADGSHFTYGKLILATGGRPRLLPLPGAQLGGLHAIRTIDDVEKMRADFLPGKRLVIVGAGYIGLEVAAVAIKAGLDVEIVEFAPRVLARVAGPELSAFYEGIHRKAGVRFRLNTGVEGFLPRDRDGTSVGAVRCSDNTDLPADLVLVAAGLVPNVELAKEAGLAMGNGIAVDEFCQTSDPDIYAIGDCVEFPLPHMEGTRIRLESVPNAQEGARVTASAIAGTPSAYAAVPWFWSDQYHFKLQSVGLSQGYDQVVLRPPRNPDGFIAFYLRNGRVIAADCVNAVPEFTAARKMVTQKCVVDAAKLADPSVELKSLLATAA